MGYLTRLAGVLLAKPLVFIGAYWILGPSGIGLFEPDRSMDTASQAERPLLQEYMTDQPVGPFQYVTADACGDCHGEEVEAWTGSSHQGAGCQTCHGPAQAHVDTGASLHMEEPRELCERCHASLVTRPAPHPQVDVEEHAGTQECTACHSPHSPRIAAPTIAHSLEGLSSCTACHGPAGSRPLPFPSDHAGRRQRRLPCMPRRAAGRRR